MQEINSIGLAAKQIARSVETLRDWDRRGLLPARRDSNGRRYYLEEDIARGQRLAKEMDEARSRGVKAGTAAA